MRCSRLLPLLQRYYRQPQSAHSSMSSLASVISRVFGRRRVQCAKAEDHDHLFRYTSGRWLYNETIQMARRYVAFNVDALGAVAAKAAGAKSCVSVEKLAEGTSNRVLLLTLDNDQQVIARLPFPLAGPPHLLTASEVATMEFARKFLHIPVPKVFAWSSRASETPVGAEFMILEKVQGIELHDAWPLVRRHINNLVKQFTTLEQKFPKATFSKFGSIYYKSDLEGYPQASSLLADESIETDFTRRFTIGPHMNWDLWRGERVDMQADRGPWDSPLSYITGLVRCEQEWLRRYARPLDSSDPFFGSVEENSPKVHEELLEQFLTVAEHLLPSAELCKPTLWHTDLHKSNIFVDATPPHNIVSVIDWQWMSVSPLYMQAVFPKAMIYGGNRIEVPPSPAVPARPDNFDQLSPEEQALVDSERVLAGLQALYCAVLRKNPPQYEALSHPHIHTIIEPVYHVTRTWYDGLYLLRYLLSDIQERWTTIVGDDIPCPLDFSPGEIQRYSEEHDRKVAYEARVDATRFELGSQPDGWVTNDKYEELKEMNETLKRSWESKAAGGPYPFQEGGKSLMI